MPTKIVMIRWDKPEDENWLNESNIAVALHAFCPNTEFYVYPEEAIVFTNYWKQEVIKLAGFLREKFPQRVDKNMSEPGGGSAVGLAIELLNEHRSDPFR